MEVTEHLDLLVPCHRYKRKIINILVGAGTGMICFPRNKICRSCSGLCFYLGDPNILQNMNHHGQRTLFLLVSIAATVHASSEIDSKNVVTSLIFDIMKNIAHFENAACHVLASEDMKYHKLPSQHLEDKNLVLSIFDSATLSGISLSESGRSCPHLIMQFGSLQNMNEFLDNHYDNIRCLSNNPVGRQKIIK